VNTNGGNAIAGISNTAYGLAANGVAALLSIDGSGNMGIAGNFYAASRKALKNNIAPLSFDPLAIVNETQVLQWCYKKSHCKPGETRNVGPMADDTDERIAGKKHDGVNVNNALFISYAAIQKLSAKVDALTARVEQLEHEKAQAAQSGTVPDDAR